VTPKKQTAIRFSRDAERLLDALKQDMGLTATAIIELAIRDLAKRRKVEVRNEEKEIAVG
jgi:predicted DNA-binding protein